MNRRQIIHEALIHHGFTPAAAAALIDEYDGWSADVIRHQAAEYLRDGVNPHVTEHEWRSRYADDLDPFEPNGAGLRRKSTGEPVPATVQADIDKE